MSAGYGNLVNRIRKYRAGEPEREEKKRLRRKRRGMTQAEFQARYDAQGGRCLIGGHPMDPPGISRNGNHPVLDHSHKTGLARGIICSNHNVALGLFRESAEDLQAAIHYLACFPKTLRQRKHKFYYNSLQNSLDKNPANLVISTPIKVKAPETPGSTGGIQ